MMEPLQTSRILPLSILAGLVAAGVLVGINLVLVQPYTNALVDIEIDNQLAEGEFFEDEFDARLQSIYFLQIYGPIAIGLSAGALVAGTYIAGRVKTSPVKAAILIAGIAWFVLYVVPLVKYPPSPEALFDPEVAGTYYTLLAGYAAVSGLSAFGIALGFRKIKRKDKAFGAAALYLGVIAGAFFAFPDYQSEDDLFLPQPILHAWRSAIAAAMTTFWFSLGIISGLLWTYGSKNVQHI